MISLRPEWPSDPRPFESRPIDKRTARAEAERIAGELSPRAVDEAVGHAMDNLVNAWAVGWAITVKDQHLSYAAAAEARVDRAEVDVTRTEARSKQDQLHLREMDAGRKAALDALVGDGVRLAAGYQNASMVAGRPLSRFVHIAAFTLAGLADGAALWQVLQLLMAESPAELAALVVVGLTAAVLYLAHMIGALWRDRVAKVSGINPLKAWLCLVVWLGLGAICFWVRLVVIPEPASSPTLGTVPADQGKAGSDLATENALMFLGLYMAAGLVAAVGAFVTHNPLATVYVAASRVQHRAARKAARSATVARRARARLQAEIAARTSAQSICDIRIHECLTFAAELKQLVRLKIAGRVQDPAFTDAIVDGDWMTHPLWPIAGHEIPPPTNPTEEEQDR